jgi:hypothetical protein
LCSRSITFLVSRVITFSGGYLSGYSSELGDLTANFLFVNAISEFYQNAHPKITPVLHRRKWPDLSNRPSELKELYKKYFAPASNPITFDDLAQLWIDRSKGSVFYRFVFSAGDIQLLKLHALSGSSKVEQKRKETQLKFGTQEVVVAFFSEVYNTVMNEPITTIRFVNSVRSFSFHAQLRSAFSHSYYCCADSQYRLPSVPGSEEDLYRHPYNVGNCFYWHDVDITRARCLPSKARTLRESIIASRNPPALERALTLCSTAARSMTPRGLLKNIRGPGVLIVDGLHK